MYSTTQTERTTTIGPPDGHWPGRTLAMDEQVSIVVRFTDV